MYHSFLQVTHTPIPVPGGLAEYGLVGLVLTFLFALIGWMMYRGVDKISSAMHDVEQSVSGTMRELAQKHSLERKEWVQMMREDRQRSEDQMREILSRYFEDREHIRDSLKEIKNNTDKLLFKSPFNSSTGKTQ